MISATPRHALRHVTHIQSSNICVSTSSNVSRQIRHATSLTSAIKLSSVPAPHIGNIAILALNRGRARNALSKSLLSELSGVVDGLHAERGSGSTRALIIASESDDSYCAGADLKERLDMSPKEVNQFLGQLRRTFTQLSELKIPTISAVSSIAFGGGFELALATHFRVFASSATVCLPETRLGIIPGAGATERLPALIGKARARDLILTGRRVTGTEAYAMGICERLVEVSGDEFKSPGLAREMVLEHALTLATEICEGAPLSTRAAMDALAAVDPVEGERTAYDMVVGTQDRLEGLRTFAEKRDRPRFKGR